MGVRLGALAICVSGWGQMEATGPSPRPTPVRPAIAQTVPSTPIDSPSGTWTLVVLPDTQTYVDRFPNVFTRQTEWIAANAARQNILFVAHEGDIVERNVPEQWERARKSLDVLVAAKVPFVLVNGNHDTGLRSGGGSKDRSTLLNDFFKPADYQSSGEVGFFEARKMENSWHELDTPTGKFLIVGLELAPRDEVLAWANRVVADKSDRTVIVVTHAYLSTNSVRFDWATKGRNQPANVKGLPFAEAGANDGEEMWRKLVSRHANIKIVLSGHTTGRGTGYLVSEGRAGNHVHQILANFQQGVWPDQGYGGAGYLRLMQFLPDGKTVRVRTYSPWYDSWLKEADMDFEFQL